MPTYTLRSRILSNPYKNSSDTYDSSDNDGNNNYWILIFLLIALTLVAIFVGSIYNTQGYYQEGFEGGASPIKNSKTLYFFGMLNCRWCQEFKSGAWKDLQNDIQKNPDKSVYLYLLTPHGLKQKALLTAGFLKRKLKEYQALKNEIKSIQSTLKILKT